jgi:hypothetical protein
MRGRASLLIDTMNGEAFCGGALKRNAALAEYGR